MPSKNFHRAPTYVDVTFKGASRRACRVGKPTSVELVINLKTAKALGLTIPQAVLLRVDEVMLNGAR
jgi:putative ABC transport system substrate-binding protein